MIKIIITSVVYLLTSLPLLSQNTTKPFYFPHKTGDMWEYFYYDYAGPMYNDTIQNFTIFESTDSFGIIHIRQHAQSILPGKFLNSLRDTTIYWIDTVNNYVWGKSISDDSSLIYKLNAQKGEQWIIRNYAQQGGIGFEIARVQDRREGAIFGKKTTFLSIIYYSALDSTDTTGYSAVGGDLIADGFGLISRGGGEAPGTINLIGAVIDGKLFGHTTLVSVKDKQNFLPTSIKLYQNYPNPFNPSTKIEFSIPSVETFHGTSLQHVVLKVYDLLGREIATLVNEEKLPGNYEATFNAETRRGESLPSGVYIYRIDVNGFTQSKKMLLMK